MKKLLVLLTFIFSLFVVSCASNSEKSPLENNIQSPVENTTSNEVDNTNENENSTISTDDENIENTDNTDESETEVFITVAESYPELDEIDEPEVITLEPPELPPVLPEATSEVTTLEPVESDLPAKTTVSNENGIPNADENKLANDNNTSNKPDDKDNTNDGIDITDDDASAKEIEEKSIEVISPSRTITLKIYEYLDITYPGSGWVYMGLTDGSKDLSYVGRKLGSSDTKFILQARAAGTKIIHFYKNDSIKKQYIDDYIEVEILEEKGSNKTHVTAPEYKTAIPAKAKKIINENNAKKELQKEEPVPVEENPKVETKPVVKTEEKPAAKVETKPVSKTETKTAAKNEPKPVAKAQEKQEPKSITKMEVEENNQPETTIDLNVLLQEAQVLYNEKEYKKAKEKVELYLDNTTQKQDEALFLKGQILEAKSDIQNIKNAIAAYTTLTKNYPASRYWDDANKRIIYLKRFYLEVR